jgi:hypothetical protein
MKKVGYQTYKHTLQSTQDTIWYQTLNPIIPFVIKRDGETVVNTKSDDPSNNLFY